jgi:hypothetical protein
MIRLIFDFHQYTDAVHFLCSMVDYQKPIDLALKIFLSQTFAAKLREFDHLIYPILLGGNDWESLIFPIIPFCPMES